MQQNRGGVRNEIENERSQEAVIENINGAVMNPDASKVEARVPEQFEEEEKRAV